MNRQISPRAAQLPDMHGDFRSVPTPLNCFMHDQDFTSRGLQSQSSTVVS
jgi:hypothetical protein